MASATAIGNTHDRRLRHSGCPAGAAYERSTAVGADIAGQRQTRTADPPGSTAAAPPEHHRHTLQRPATLAETLLAACSPAARRRSPHPDRARPGLDDPAIYNADNLKVLLLTSYARDRVLIGPSAPFIAAGSLSTTYSSPQDMADSIISIWQSPWQPAAIRYPDYFSVLSNLLVAQSIGLPPPDDPALMRRIHAQEQIR